jgi:hypothetical protein
VPGLRAAQRICALTELLSNCSLKRSVRPTHDIKVTKVMDNFDRVCNITNAMRSDEAMERYAYIYRMKGGDIYSAEMAI